MFQGGATNLKHWNYYTKSKFLDRLKTLGSIYTYQDKTNNIFHYEKTNIEHIDYDSDIDFNLSYIKPNTHIKMIYLENQLRPKEFSPKPKEKKDRKKKLLFNKGSILNNI